MLHSAIEFISGHYQWLFSGIGVSLLGWVLWRKASIKQNQSVSDGANAVQVGNDIKVNVKIDSD